MSESDSSRRTYVTIVIIYFATGSPRVGLGLKLLLGFRRIGFRRIGTEPPGMIVPEELMLQSSLFISPQDLQG